MSLAYQEPVVQVWKHRIALVFYLGCYHSKSFCKYPGCHSEPKGEDTKLEELLANHEVQKLPVRWMNICVEICILPVESHEPHSFLKGKDYKCQHSHPEFQLSNKDVELPKVQDVSPSSAFFED